MQACGRLTDIQFFGNRQGLISDRYHRATKSILSKLFFAIHLLH